MPGNTGIYAAGLGSVRSSCAYVTVVPIRNLLRTANREILFYLQCKREMYHECHLNGLYRFNARNGQKQKDKFQGNITNQSMIGKIFNGEIFNQSIAYLHIFTQITLNFQINVKIS